MRAIWWREVISPNLLGKWCFFLIHLSNLPLRSDKGNSIVTSNWIRQPTVISKSIKCSKKGLCGELRDDFDMSGLCRKAYKDANVALGRLYSTTLRSRNFDGTCIIQTGSCKWRCEYKSIDWQWRHLLRHTTPRITLTNRAFTQDRLYDSQSTNYQILPWNRCKNKFWADM